MTEIGDFTSQYAIRMPNGQLVCAHPSMGGQILLFDNRPAAEHALRQLVDNAHHMGITEYFGEVVERRCTPFIGLNDSAEHLVEELTKWLKSQGGKQQ